MREILTSIPATVGSSSDWNDRSEGATLFLVRCAALAGAMKVAVDARVDDENGVKIAEFTVPAAGTYILTFGAVPVGAADFHINLPQPDYYRFRVLTVTAGQNRLRILKL